MTDRSDDRPLTSEEMIRAARSDLDRRPTRPSMELDTDQIREQVEAEMPSPEELARPSNYTARSVPDSRPRTPRRVTRAERRTPAGFGDGRPRAGNAIAVVVAMALLVLGAAVFLVLAASGTG